MKIAEQFRAPKDFEVHDDEAGRKPLSSGDKEQDKLHTLELAQQIADLQDVLYAEHRRKLLVILQGTDTAGKDGAIKGVFGLVDPLGVRSVAFRAPTFVERGHDFLWRIHAQVPGNGEIVIFNRSQYEEVLVTRVHEWIDDDECQRRYRHIRAFESLLTETGTVVLKFFLHISKDEQRERLQARVDNPDKHWKFDPQDLVERKHWKDYQRAYQEAIRETNTDNAPWYVIPADSKTHRNLAIASIVLETMQDMKLDYPPANPELSGLKVE